MREELIDRVYKKLSKEYKELIESFRDSSFEDLIKNAYKITICEQFPDMFYGSSSYSNNELKGLLLKDNSLEHLYKDWKSSDNGLHNILEDNIYECLVEIEEEFVKDLTSKAEKDPNYELIKNMSEALQDFNNYNFCDDMKRKFEVDDFEISDVYQIITSKGGKNYLYDFFNEIKNNEQLNYLNEISVINSTNFDNIEEIFLPKLKEIIKEEKKNISKKGKEQER